MKIGSLFSGIGGLDLGVERATGGQVIWQCEADPFCRSVLAKHWPGVPCFDDVRTLDDPPRVDLLCGGFPCQDISGAGRKAGIDGDKSGLWAEFFRIICKLRPGLVFVENVAALTARGLDRVLGDLASIRFDAEWGCLRASDVGAPHIRRRIFILASNADGDGESAVSIDDEAPGLPGLAADSECNELREQRQRDGQQRDEQGASESSDYGWWGAETKPPVCRVDDGPVPKLESELRSLIDEQIRSPQGSAARSDTDGTLLRAMRVHVESGAPPPRLQQADGRRDHVPPLPHESSPPTAREGLLDMRGHVPAPRIKNEDVQIERLSLGVWASLFGEEVGRPPGGERVRLVQGEVCLFEGAADVLFEVLREQARGRAEGWQVRARLHALGNSVVPQQAEAAFRLLARRLQRG